MPGHALWVLALAAAAALGFAPPTTTKCPCRRLAASQLLSDEDLLSSSSSSSTTDSRDADRGNWDHGYVRVGDLSVEVPEEVHELLTDRVLAKRARDFEAADALRDELAEKHNVRVFDKTREFFVGRVRKEVTSHDYARDPEDETPGVDVERVNAILVERLRRKLGREFDEADALRDELRTLGVRVDDNNRTWRAGIPEDVREDWERHRQFVSRYRRVCSPDEKNGEPDNPVDEEAVLALLGQRHAARRRRLWDKADAKLDLLFRMGVSVDDATQTWMANEIFQPKFDDDKLRLAADYDAARVAAFYQILDDRRYAKLKRDWDLCDTLRSRAADDFDVAMDDKHKLWWFLAQPPSSARLAASLASSSEEEDDSADDEEVLSFQDDDDADVDDAEDDDDVAETQ